MLMRLEHQASYYMKKKKIVERCFEALRSKTAIF